MHVLRHHHVTQQRELVSTPYLSQHLHKKISCAGCAQPFLSPIATERNEVQMPLAVNSNQFISHVRDGNTAPLQTKGCGTRDACATRQMQKQIPCLRQAGSSDASRILARNDNVRRRRRRSAERDACVARAGLKRRPYEYDACSKAASSSGCAGVREADRRTPKKQMQSATRGAKVEARQRPCPYERQRRKSGVVHVDGVRPMLHGQKPKPQVSPDAEKASGRDLSYRRAAGPRAGLKRRPYEKRGGKLCAVHADGVRPMLHGQRRKPQVSPDTNKASGRDLSYRRAAVRRAGGAKAPPLRKAKRNLLFFTHLVRA
jgi:hypothetical protein